MAGKNYQIGRRFEYRVQNYLRKKGFYVIRAYGSKGLVDLVAVWPSIGPEGWNNLTLMIQCKSNGYVKPDEMKTLKECEHKWNGWILIAQKDGNHHVMFRTLDNQKIVSI